jgi:hypothetical protein
MANLEAIQAVLTFSWKFFLSVVLPGTIFNI